MFKIFLSLILSLNIIFSNFISVNAQENISVMPKIYGEAYVVIDGETNEVILGKNVNEKMYPASVTKLITAILLAENKKPNDTLLFTESAKQMPEYSINLNYYPMEVGQELSADFVMKSILIFSANDMAQVVADNISQMLNKSFEQLMNDKLKELGIKNTHFVNAVGLHDDQHYSTAYDLTILLKEALKYDWIREVMRIEKTTVTLPDGSLIVYENSNKLLGTEGMIGGKTGYTSRAGRNLVGAFELNGKTYIICVLKSVYDSEDTYVFKDMLNLMEVAKTKEKTVFIPKGQDYSRYLDLKYKLFGFFGPEKVESVPIEFKEDIYIYDNDFNRENLKTEITAKDNINIFTNGSKPVGKFKITIGEYEKSYNVYANMKGIIFDNILIYVLVIILFILVVGVFIFLILKIFRPKKNKRIWWK